MKNFIETGDIVEVTAPSDVLSGQGVLVGKLFGMAVADAASGKVVNVKTLGVFEVPKTSAQAWSQGADIYWDNTAKVFTTTASGNALVAKAMLAAANPSGIGTVRLNGA